MWFCMKNKLFFVFIIVILNSFVWAKPNLEMNGIVKKSLDDFSQIKYSYLKSNTLASRKTALVEVNLSSKKTIDSLNMLLKNEYRVIESRGTFIRLKNERLHIGVPDLETNRALIAQRVLNIVMPHGFDKYFMLVSIDVVRSFSVNQGAEIEGFTLNFKRVFNGRLVRNNDNFLKVQIDKKGYLESLDVALQDLKIGAESVDSYGDAAECEFTLDSLFEANFDYAYVVDDDGVEKKKKIENVKLTSVTEAYCEIIEDDKKMLFPCLSYTSKIDLNENELFDYIIDVPHSRKSWSDYYAKKSSVYFDSYRF